MDDDDWKAVFTVAIGWPIVLPIACVVFIKNRGFFDALVRKREIRIRKEKVVQRAELVLNAIDELNEEDTDALRRMGVIE